MVNGIFMLEKTEHTVYAVYHGARFGGRKRNIGGSSNPRAYVNLCNRGLANLTQQEIDECRGFNEFCHLAFNNHYRPQSGIGLEERVRTLKEEFQGRKIECYGIVDIILKVATVGLVIGWLGYQVYGAKEDSPIGKCRDRAITYIRMHFHDSVSIVEATKKGSD